MWFKVLAQQRTTVIAADADRSVKVIAPQNPVNVTKGFDLTAKPSDLTKIQVTQVTSRSQSPASGRATPVNTEAEEVRTMRRENKPDPDVLYKKERGDGKEHLYMVVVGHVDAGKSTLMGRLLCDLGQVSSA